MIRPKKVILVSRATIKDLVSGQIFLIAFFIGLALAVLSYIGVELSYGAPKKVALDFGMGLISLANIVICLFLGVRVLQAEVENRTLYMILSRPVSRTEFYLGKFFGLAFCVLAINLILALQTLFTFFIYGGSFDPLIPWAVIFTYLEGILILAFVILFSIITTNIAATLYGISILIFGHAVPNLLDLNFVKNNPGLHWFVEKIGYIIPDLVKINIKDHLLYGKEISQIYLFSGLAYILIFITLVCFVTSVVFKRKDLN
tara:strand:- start:564 stop:1340 length:777 start_codon:yes stop_codon:yes gene_type:complete